MLSDATTACRAYHTASAVVWSAWGSWGLWAFMALVLPSTRGKSINLTEVWLMDDTGCRGFFLEPRCDLSPARAALRAFFIEGRRLHDIAQQFGYRETSLRSMVCRFRAPSASWRGPPFWAADPGAPPAPASRPEPAVPETTVIADARVEPCSGTSPAHARRGYFSSCPC